MARRLKRDDGFDLLTVNRRDFQMFGRGNVAGKNANDAGLLGFKPYDGGLQDRIDGVAGNLFPHKFFHKSGAIDLSQFDNRRTERNRDKS